MRHCAGLTGARTRWKAYILLLLVVCADALPHNNGPAGAMMQALLAENGVQSQMHVMDLQQQWLGKENILKYSCSR